MVVVSAAAPALSGQLELFHTTDPLLYNSPLLIFYGQAASVGASSSRIQVHIFTPAGLESFTRLSISPNSPHYAAVTALPREEQGEESCRGIAYALAKYFAELSPQARECWTTQVGPASRASSPFGLFSPTHVAVLASRLTRVENGPEVTSIIQRALGEQHLSWLDVDIVLPQSSIKQIDGSVTEDLSDEELCRQRYGRYSPILSALGEPSFLPTSKMKRAASKPTMVGRSSTFCPGQRELIRKEMCELVDTEESYVNKLVELKRDIGDALQSQFDGTLPDSNEVQIALQQLFPESLNIMMRTNKAFLSSIRDVLDNSDESAMEELESESTGQAINTNINDDSLGITSLSKALLDHFPFFTEAYPAYMSSSAATTKLLRTVTKSTQSRMIQTIHRFGEQKLASLLIEPVQRLPRYTLYIDTISKQLPIGHPALTLLLKARDIITNICLSDDGVANVAETRSRLATLVEGFENNEQDVSRLLNVIDVSLMAAPFDARSSTREDGLLLVFTNRIMYLTKINSSTANARALQSELDKPVHFASGIINASSTDRGLRAMAEFFLDECILTESIDGKTITLFGGMDEDGEDSQSSHTFLLAGSYAGKASRLAEEVVKARVAGRFTEVDRESHTWDVRCAIGNSNELNMFAAVFEYGQLADYGGHLRIEVDLNPTSAPAVPQVMPDITLRITPGGNTFCHVALDSRYGSLVRDKVALSELISSISRRVAPILQAQLSMKHSAHVAALVARNRAILESLELVLDNGKPNVSGITLPAKAARPISPVKTLTGFISNRTGNHGAVLKKNDSVLSVMPNLPPKTSLLPRPGSGPNSRPSSKENLPPIDLEVEPSIKAANKFKRLEDIMSTYLLALQARKGNVVGRVIKGRGNAEEAQVNDLYNALLENPSLMVLAAQAPVDVLFVAFERFLQNEWKNKLGNIMERSMLVEVQHEAESKFPVDFEAYFLNRFLDLSPQNQRGLKGIVKLLAELLDGAGNDGDRGLLISAFTELLVPGEDPAPFVSIMDRFVDDIESLFGETVHERLTAPNTPSLGHSRSKSATTGSLNSNTSSLRKKFGFGASVSRDTGRPEPDSKVGSVWRSLSKNKQGPDPITPRVSLQRTRSTDTDVREGLKRPGSQDRPAALGQFSFERPSSQDSGFLLSTPLSTIGESGTPRSGPPKKKRRSSLSDLSLMQSPYATPIKASPGSTRLETIMDKGKDLESNDQGQTYTPSRSPQRSRLPSSFRKENSPAPGITSTTFLPRPRSSGKQDEDVKITAYQSSKIATAARPTSASRQGVPAPLRVGLSERPSGNAMKIKPTPVAGMEKAASTVQTSLPSPTTKLRIQSPQRLRERLQSEQRELQQASVTFQDEISKIGDEIASSTPKSSARINNRAGSIRLAGGKPAPSAAPLSLSQTTARPAADVAKKLAELAAMVTARLDDMQAKNKSLQDETLSALALSEARTKRLDELYREANAENEALYARFNDELGKVVRMIRGGEGVEELKRRLNSGEEEMEGLRRERARLRREVVGLRGRLGE